MMECDRRSLKIIQLTTTTKEPIEHLPCPSDSRDRKVSIQSGSHVHTQLIDHSKHPLGNTSLSVMSTPNDATSFEYATGFQPARTRKNRKNRKTGPLVQVPLSETFNRTKQELAHGASDWLKESKGPSLCVHKTSNTMNLVPNSWIPACFRHNPRVIIKTLSSFLS